MLRSTLTTILFGSSLGVLINVGNWFGVVVTN